MQNLIYRLAGRFSDLTEADILQSIEIIIEAMSARLIDGGRIELRRFGSFSLNVQAIGANENLTSETENAVTDTSLVVFKPGLDIREKVNTAYSQ